MFDLKSTTLIALLGATQATAVPSPSSPGSAFPSYQSTTAYTTASSEVQATFDILSSIGGTAGIYGSYNCVRQGLIWVPTQKTSARLTSAGQTATTITVQTHAAGGLVHFYAQTSAATGTYPTYAANGQTAAFDGWTCCTNAAFNTAGLTGATCQTAVEIALNATGPAIVYGPWVPRRIIVSPTQQSAIAKLYATAGTNILHATAEAWNWNSDFVFAVQAQQSAAAVGGTAGNNWCSLGQQAKTAATNVVHESRQGLTGKSKCTFVVGLSTMAVGMNLSVTTLNYGNFLLQWAEWADSASVPAGFFLPTAADTTNYQVVAMANAAATLYPNPLLNGGSIAATWTSAANAPAAYNNSAARGAGDLGDFMYLNENAPWGTAAGNTNGVITVSQWELAQSYAQLQTAYSAYSTDVGLYNTAVGLYNTQVEAWTTWVAAPAFQATPKVNERPCLPGVPMSWTGPLVDLTNVAATHTWITGASFNKTNKTAYPFGYTGTPAVATGLQYTVRSGYLQATSDNATTAASLTAANWANAVHVFGRLGQGSGLTTATKPWVWAAPTAAKVQGLAVSVLPEVSGDTGLAATKLNQLTVADAAWETNSSFSAPTKPNAPSAPACYAGKTCPDQLMGASALTLGAAAVLVAATLA